MVLGAIAGRQGAFHGFDVCFLGDPDTFHNHHCLPGQLATICGKKRIKHCSDQLCVLVFYGGEYSNVHPCEVFIKGLE